MSSYVQSLYRQAIDSERTDDKFLKKMEEKYSKNSIHNIKSNFKTLKTMCVIKGTTFESVVHEFTEMKNTVPEDKYLEIISKFLQDFIDFNMSSRPCPRCFVKNTNEFNSKKCPQCNDTQTVNGVNASAIGIYLAHMKKPLRYYGLLSGISNEDLHAELIMPTIDDEEPEPLTVPFIKAILDKVKGERKLYWQFVATSGTRGNEGIQILPEDCKFVDEEQMPVSTGENYFRIKIILRSSTTKSNKSREIFVAKEIQNDMERLIKNTPIGTPLFRKSNTTVQSVKNYNNRLFVDICKKLACEDPVMYGKLNERKNTGYHKFTFHSFRSFAVTQLNRVNYGFGHALAGHKVYMGMYNRLTVEQKKEYLEKSDEYLAIFTDAKTLSLKDKRIKELEDDAERRKTYYEDQNNKINARLIKLENKM